MLEVSFPLAFLAGIFTFFTPCILPVLPAYLSFITGEAVEDLLAHKPVRREMLPPMALFCLGFSVVFVILGATATALGRLLAEYQRVLEVAGGVVVVLMGLHQVGLFNPMVLNRETRIRLNQRPAHGLAAFFIGVAFAAGWTPCLGPVLGAILAYASTRETVTQGVVLLTFFSIGMSLPFLALGLALGTALPKLRAIGRLARWIKIGSGCVLILLGILLLGDKMSQVLRWLS